VPALLARKAELVPLLTTGPKSLMPAMDKHPTLADLLDLGRSLLSYEPHWSASDAEKAKRLLRALEDVPAIWQPFPGKPLRADIEFCAGAFSSALDAARECLQRLPDDPALRGNADRHQAIGEQAQQILRDSRTKLDERLRKSG
jgi:hypothetical protein